MVTGRWERANTVRPYGCKPVDGSVFKGAGEHRRSGTNDRSLQRLRSGGGAPIRRGAESVGAEIVGAESVGAESVGAQLPVFLRIYETETIFTLRRAAKKAIMCKKLSRKQGSFR